jgi:DNA polymerase-3 subunit gamma/tau
MYQVIARKYRPQNFGELIGQEHVKTTLENAITQQRIAHGYIFSGQRGTGKTTVARILARCLNCEQGPTPTPCGKCASCLEIAAGNSMDVIEIDAASNRGINEMRELRENVRFRPARDRYKVFIVDEAHQITNEAFNALLKTLEEPPEWVVFVLCTTEAHKIPSTIVSRTQQFSFRSVDFAELVTRMEWILTQEGIAADPEVLSVLAQAGEGSVRDSLSALDQAIACCGTTLHAAEVRGLLGMFSLESLDQIAKALVSGESHKMLEVVAELEANGRSLQHFSRELARYFRNLLVVKIAKGETRLVAASGPEQAKLGETAAQFSEEDLTRFLQLSLDLFRDLQSSLQPRLHLEIGLLRMVHAGKLQSIEEALASLGGSGAGSGSGSGPVKPTGGSPPRPVSTPTSRQAAEVAAPPAAISSPVAASGDLRTRLHAALIEAKQMHVADALEHSDVVEAGNEILFTTPAMYTFYLKQPDFEAAVRKVLGRPVKLTVKAGEAAHSPVAAASPSQTAAPKEDEVTARALSHPEVRKFQELFPDSQVRTVRNLREN